MVLNVTPVVSLKPGFCGHNSISLFDITTSFWSFKFETNTQTSPIYQISPSTCNQAGPRKPVKSREILRRGIFSM